MGDISNATARRSQSRPRLAGLAVLVATSLLACVGPDPFGGLATQRSEPPSECGAPSFSCALPFPSDRWQVADPGTATGVRLEIPPNSIDRSVLDQLGPRDEAAEALLGADGFSPLSPIVFQLPDALALDAVAPDGGGLVDVFDAATGGRIAVRAEVSQYLSDERGAHNLILVWPATMFAYGHEVFAGLRRGVVAADGAAASPSPSLGQASSATRAMAARARAVGPVERLPRGDVLRRPQRAVDRR